MVLVNVSMHRKKKKKSDVKEVFQQLLNKYQKRLQEDVHKVSSQILPLGTSWPLKTVLLNYYNFVQKLNVTIFLS